MYKKNSQKPSSLLKQSTWRLTLGQTKPLAGTGSHALIQRKKVVTCRGDFHFEYY